MVRIRVIPRHHLLIRQLSSQENDKLKDTVQRLSTAELDLKAAISKESKGKVFAEAGLLDMEGELDTARQKNIELAQTIVALENVKTHQKKVGFLPRMIFHISIKRSKDRKPMI